MKDPPGGYTITFPTLAQGCTNYINYLIYHVAKAGRLTYDSTRRPRSVDLPSFVRGLGYTIYGDLWDDATAAARAKPLCCITRMVTSPEGSVKANC